MTQCLFCKIASGEIPSEKVWEDEYSFAVLDVQPLAPGHTMVLPKEHAATILELSDSALATLMPAVKTVTAAIQKALSPDGFTIGINHKIGQTVDHLHIHILPRWHNDGGGNIHSIVHNQPKEELSQTAEKIRKAL